MDNDTVTLFFDHTSAKMSLFFVSLHPMILRETIEKIREAARIEEVVGDFVSLKKHGGNYIACCPFHNEKTPSFHVNTARGIFKCFGCGEAGDSISFLMKHERYTYPEALRYLATKYHIPIEETRPSDEERQLQSERDALFHLNEFAQKYFANILYNDEDGRAVGLSYLHGRGLTDEVIRKFGLGFCKDTWDDFTTNARRNGYSDEVLRNTGLTVFRDDNSKRSYDRFRARVMFPIFSISGRVIGFSGRVLSKEKQAAKYVNSPESEIYIKGNSLYGLYQARQAISRKDKCYLVEGNIDVVSMHQSGVENTVASCGTALTSQQIRLIKRYSSHVTVVYDGDAAGIKATIKAVDLLFVEGMHVRMVLFPDGHDPDSYAQQYGSSQLQQYLNDHEENFLLYRMQLAKEEIANDPIRKAELENELVNTIALVPDTLERSAYVSQFCTLFKIDEATVRTLIAKRIASNLRQQHVADDNTAAAPNPTPATVGDTTQPPLEAEQVQPVRPNNARQNDSALKEHKLVSLLVRFGDRTISDGNVADLIVNEVKNEGLQFNDPVLQRIFDLFDRSLQKGDPLPDANFFSRTDDVAMRICALNMMMEDNYTVSERWHEKHINVPTIERQLGADVLDSVLNFKDVKLLESMKSIDERLRATTDEDEQRQLLSLKEKLFKARTEVGKKMHRVIT